MLRDPGCCSVRTVIAIVSLSIPCGGRSNLSGMRSDLMELSKRVRAARGRDRELDKSIAELLDHSAAKITEYTGSVDACIDLIHRVLPGWFWHVGYGPRGVLPYAALWHGDARHETSAPTVPLALLAAILETKVEEHNELTD
jgi:hypothetical protein